MKSILNHLPDDFLNRLKDIVPKNRYQEALDSFSRPSLIVIRVNTLVSTIEEVKEVLKANRIKYEKISWYPSAFVLPEATTKDVTSLSEYGQGKIYIQSLSSMIPAVVLDPHGNENILDITAAPGSKTTQMAALMNNKGTIIANDISRARMYKLKDNLRNFHVKNTTLTFIHGEQIWKKYPELFDKTLVDAPCSMEGRFKTSDHDSYKDWSFKKVKELSHRQKYLLRSAISATKVGGSIIYSTCTLSPEENEEVIDWVLGKENGKIHLEKIEVQGLDQATNGLTSWKEKVFDPSLSKTLRIMPNDIYEGFFVAKIVKDAQTTDLATYL